VTGEATPQATDAMSDDERRVDGEPVEVRPRGEFEVRWRQAKNAPPPIVRAIVADLAVAIVAGIVLLAWDRTLGAGLGAFVLYFVVVVGAGSILTYLWAPLPSGASGVRRRSPWAAMLGLFAAFPVAYIVLVVAFQVVRPWL
jgi:hypothetical protein